MRIKDSGEILLFLSIVVSVPSRFLRFILFLNHEFNRFLDYISRSLRQVRGNV